MSAPLSGSVDWRNIHMALPHHLLAPRSSRSTDHCVCREQKCLDTLKDLFEKYCEHEQYSLEVPLRVSSHVLHDTWDRALVDYRTCIETLEDMTRITGDSLGKAKATATKISTSIEKLISKLYFGGFTPGPLPSATKLTAMLSAIVGSHSPSSGEQYSFSGVLTILAKIQSAAEAGEDISNVSPSPLRPSADPHASFDTGDAGPSLSPLSTPIPPVKKPKTAPVENEVDISSLDGDADTPPCAPPFPEDPVGVGSDDVVMTCAPSVFAAGVASHSTPGALRLLLAPRCPKSHPNALQAVLGGSRSALSVD